MDYRLRQEKVLRALAEEKMAAMMITHLPNIAYLCGFTGSAGVLVASEARWVLFTDGRYTAQAHEQAQGAQVVISKGAALAAAAAWAGKLSPPKSRRTQRRAGAGKGANGAPAAHAAGRIGIEAEHMTVAMRRALLDGLSQGAKLKETGGLVERLRMVKEAEEIERLRAAAITGSTLLESALEILRPGVSEAAVAGAIEFAARRKGCEGMSFPTIVASGTRSALPHGTASAAPIPRGGFVVMDFGVILGGYCSDMTRTVHVGRASGDMRTLYEAVREAQQAGIEAVRAGVEAGKVDQATRQALRRAGLARFFTHSTGHGVGLEIHEIPRVAHAATQVLEPGMVITIEPGVYVAGKGGVRIEDMVLVTERGCEVLTPSAKDLITLE